MWRNTPSFLRHIARLIHMRFHTTEPAPDEEWIIIHKSFTEDVSWPPERSKELPQIPSDAAPPGGSNETTSSSVRPPQRPPRDSSLELDSVAQLDRDLELAFPDMYMLNSERSSSPVLVPVTSSSSCGRSQTPKEALVDYAGFPLYPVRPLSIRPPEEHGILLWQPIDKNNKTHEQQVVEIIKPDGTPGKRIPIRNSVRRLAKMRPRAHRPDQPPVPTSAVDHLNSTSFSGSDIPQGELYQLELDWVMAHEDGATRQTRMLGVSGEPFEPISALVVRPTTWHVIQRTRISVDPDSSSLTWVSGGILGQGAYSKVYLVYHKPAGKQFAMKVIYMKRPLPAIVCHGIANELRVLEVLYREKKPLPFLLKPVAMTQKWTWTSTDGFVHILTDYCSGGDLFEYKGSLSEESLRYVIAELVIAIESLHKLGIVHHDIKPENILVDSDGHCVLADFGGSKFLSGTRVVKPHPSGQVVATLPYAAPELLSDIVTEDYDVSIDWWALGATVITLVTGQEYFAMEPKTRLRNTMASHLQNIRATLEVHGQCPPKLIDLVEDLLQVNPNMRPTADAIRCHPYFAKLPYSWDDIALRSPGMASPLPVIHPAPTRNPDVHSTCKDWPSHFDMNNPDQCYLLAELRKEGLTLPIDNSCDVLLMHYRTVHA